MISYCIAAYRPPYVRRLIADLIKKTTVPFEVLVWINVADAELERCLSELVVSGAPVRVIGHTPDNIGMRAYLHLFEAARFDMITQIDDDVVCVSPQIAERAAAIFARHASIRQIAADPWQDAFTCGARPGMGAYRCVDARLGLYDGPIDGWFSIYHRSILPMLRALPYAQYCFIGGHIQGQLRHHRLQGVLCTRMQVFHVIGPEYASMFDMLDFEIAKYRAIGRSDIVNWYEGARAALPGRAVLEHHYALMRQQLECAVE
jgi:hypothetical protein